jgi:hypothetical protein
MSPNAQSVDDSSVANSTTIQIENGALSALLPLGLKQIEAVIVQVSRTSLAKC